MDRADSLLLELQHRHRNHDPRFLAAVRPMVDRILDPGMPIAARVPLLELLAETFQRDAEIRSDTAASLRGLAEWVQAMQRRFGLA